MRTPKDQIEMMDKLRVHADQYARESKACYLALESVFADLEMHDDQQRHELDEIMAKARGVWTAAVAEAQARQQTVRNNIQQLLSDIMTIKEELGADNPAADSNLQV
jgi:hypothetical protein